MNERTNNTLKMPELFKLLDWYRKVNEPKRYKQDELASMAANDLGFGVTVKNIRAIEKAEGISRQAPRVNGETQDDDDLAIVAREVVFLLNSMGFMVEKELLDIANRGRKE